jgi:TPR repeat protein
LRNAAEGGSSEAMLLLGDAALSGVLGNDRASEALLWAGKAGDKGRAEAKFLAGRAWLMQAEEKSKASRDEARPIFEKSLALLEEAGAHNDKAWFFAAQAAYYLDSFARMIECLQKGKDAQDPGATYMLALCYLNGQAPLEQNISVGRQLMIEAAKRGHQDAVAWCKENRITF